MGEEMKFKFPAHDFISHTIWPDIKNDKVILKEPGFSLSKVRHNASTCYVIWMEVSSRLKNGSLLVKCCLFRCDVLENLLLVLYEAVKLQHVHTVVFYWSCRTALITQILIYWLFILSPFFVVKMGGWSLWKGFWGSIKMAWIEVWPAFPFIAQLFPLGSGGPAKCLGQPVGEGKPQLLSSLGWKC